MANLVQMYQMSGGEGGGGRFCIGKLLILPHEPVSWWCENNDPDGGGGGGDKRG